MKVSNNIKLDTVYISIKLFVCINIERIKSFFVFWKYLLFTNIQFKFFEHYIKNLLNKWQVVDAHKTIVLIKCSLLFLQNKETFFANKIYFFLASICNTIKQFKYLITLMYINKMTCFK